MTLPARVLKERLPFGSIKIDEPIASANAAATLARAAGAQAVVALTDLETTGIGIAGAHTGPLIDFAGGLEGVDVVIGATSNEGEPGTPQGDVVSVAIIPHTYARTNLHRLKVGQPVNIEADVLIKFMEQQSAGQRFELTLEYLIANGY